MSLKHLTYFSKAKLDLYYPQIPERFLSGATAKIGFNIGIVSAEIGASAVESSSDFGKLNVLIGYLENQGLVGAEIESKPFIRGTMNASALLDPPRIFFSGTIAGTDDKVEVCFCASAKHMIGYDPTIETTTRRDMSIGPVEANIFHLNSNTVGFADRLSEISDVTRRLAESPQPLTSSFSAVDFLRPEEKSAYKRRAFLNPLIARLYPSNPFDLDLSHWKRELLSTIFLGPLFFALLGPGGRSAKRRAIAKLRHSSKYADASKAVSEEEQKILNAAAIIGSRARAERYEFVARRLLQGFSSTGEKVLLASPLYMALMDRV